MNAIEKAQQAAKDKAAADKKTGTEEEGKEPVKSPVKEKRGSVFGRMASAILGGKKEEAPAVVTTNDAAPAVPAAPPEPTAEKEAVPEEVNEPVKSPVKEKRGSVFGRMASAILGGKKDEAPAVVTTDDAAPEPTAEATTPPPSADVAAEAVPEKMVVTSNSITAAGAGSSAVPVPAADEKVSKNEIAEMVKLATSTAESWESRTPDEQMLRPGMTPLTDAEVQEIKDKKAKEAAVKTKSSEDIVRDAMVAQMNAKLTADAKKISDKEEEEAKAKTATEASEKAAETQALSNYASSLAAQLPSRRPSLSGSRRPSIQQLPKGPSRRPSSLSLFKKDPVNVAPTTGGKEEVSEVDANIENANAVEDDRLTRCRNWIVWFQELVPDVSAENSMKYVDILWDAHLTTPARLKKSVARNPDLLAELLFHDDDASDIMDALARMELSASEMLSPIKEVNTKNPFAVSNMTPNTPTAAGAAAVAVIGDSPLSATSVLSSEKVEMRGGSISSSGTAESGAKEDAAEPLAIEVGDGEDAETVEARRVAAEYAEAIAKAQKQLQSVEEEDAAAAAAADARKEAEEKAKKEAQEKADIINSKYIPLDAKDIVSLITINIADKFQWGKEINGLVISLQISGIDLWINGCVLGSSHLNPRCHRVCLQDAVEFDLNLSECSALKLELCEATVSHAIHAKSIPEKYLRSLYYPDLGSIPIPHGAKGVSTEVFEKRMHRLAKWAAFTQTQIDKLDKDIVEELAAIKSATEEKMKKEKEAEDKRKADALATLKRQEAEAKAKKDAEDAKMAEELKAKMKADAEARLALSERNAKQREEDERLRILNEKHAEEAKKKKEYEEQRARVYGDAVSGPKKDEAAAERPKTWAEKQAEKKALDSNAPSPLAPAPSPMPVLESRPDMSPAEILKANRALRNSIPGKPPGPPPAPGPDLPGANVAAAEVKPPAPPPAVRASISGPPGVNGVNPGPPPGRPRRQSVAADPNAPPPPLGFPPISAGPK